MITEAANRLTALQAGDCRHRRLTRGGPSNCEEGPKYRYRPEPRLRLERALADDKQAAGEGNAYQLGLNWGVDPDQHAAGAFGNGGSFNYSPYENTRVDELMKPGRRIADLAERARTIKKLSGC